MDWSNSPRRKGKSSRYKDKVAPPVGAEKARHLALKESFDQRSYEVPLGSSASPPRPNRNSSENYLEVLLSHARVYVFAEKWIIQPLKKLATKNLHSSLANYTLFPERVSDIVALLEYVYPRTVESKDGHEEMRELLMSYVETEMEILVEAVEFQELLAKPLPADLGDLLRDFLKTVAKRIK